jgi:hypothetical protein
MCRSHTGDKADRKAIMIGNDDSVMFYVAADPEQPGAAWAAYVDDPTHSESVKKNMAKEIASWVRKGATVRRVSAADARAMLTAWKRPEKKAKKPDAAGLF